MKLEISKLKFHQKGSFKKVGRFLISKEPVCVPPVPKKFPIKEDEFISSKTAAVASPKIRK
jgi:hypothetical protein